MQAVRSTNTTPELLVRSAAHRLGYRFRLHAANLPGKPDLVFAGRRKVIFVHGCFWHGHTCARGARIPRTNTAYWLGKIGRNTRRDAATKAQLRRLGWRVLTIWECDLKNLDRVRTKLATFLSS
jgi:DNA mismatch endonuclease (patch repair protein)